MRGRKLWQEPRYSCSRKRGTIDERLDWQDDEEASGYGAGEVTVGIRDVALFPTLLRAPAPAMIEPDPSAHGRCTTAGPGNDGPAPSGCARTFGCGLARVVFAASGS